MGHRVDGSIDEYTQAYLSTHQSVAVLEYRLSTHEYSIDEVYL